MKIIIGALAVYLKTNHSVMVLTQEQSLLPKLSLGKRKLEMLTYVDANMLNPKTNHFVMVLTTTRLIGD